MRWLFNLSFRHKIPLWTSFLIGLSILVVGAALMARTYEDMKSAVVISAENLGHTLANTVAPTLLHDDVWRAFEIVRSPIRGESAQTPVEVDAVVVLARDHKVFVSSHPETLPMLVEAALITTQNELRNGISSIMGMALRDFLAHRQQLRLPLDDPNHNN